MDIKDKTGLLTALTSMFVQPIIDADYSEETLQGGTIGDVRLVEGTAKTADGKRLPFKIVWKTQKYFERPGDPGSWRREYDLYMSDLDSFFTDSFRWPVCYHAEINDEALQLWLEYIDGASGGDLTIEMMELAALELGRFQARIAKHPELSIPCLGDPGFLERNFDQWHNQSFSYEFLISESCRIPEFMKQQLRDRQIRLIDGKSFEYSCLRSSACQIPAHLIKMLTDFDDGREEMFRRFKALPIVLCHRDYWNENIFFTEGKLRLIDWDTTGWGYLGEDFAQLISDGTDMERLDEYYHRLFPAYIRGISEEMTLPPIDNYYIWEMILLWRGYRLVQDYMFTESPDDREEAVFALQKIYDLKGK